MPKIIFVLAFILWCAAAMKTPSNQLPKGIKEKNEDELCVICFDAVEHKKDLFKSSGCKHIFHFDCMNKWLQNNEKCPTCRTQITHVEVLNTISEFRKMKCRSEITPAAERKELLYQVCKLSLFWSVVQTGIFGAYFCLPNWHTWFPWMQSLNNVPWIIAIFSTFFSKNREIGFNISRIFVAVSGVLTYHSAMVFTFLEGLEEGGEGLIGELFKFGTSIAWFWIFLGVVWLIRDSWNCGDEPVFTEPLTRRQHSGIYLWWAFVQSVLIIGKYFVPKWTNWFVWMQAFQAISLLFKISSNLAPSRIASESFAVSTIILSATAIIISYHSILAFVLTGSNWGYAVFWPWFGVILSCVLKYLVFDVESFTPEPQFVRSHLAKNRLPFFWTLVQVGIILARFYIPEWSDWFPWMQGFHGTAFVLAVISKSLFRRNFSEGCWVTFVAASGLTAFVAALAYHSLMGFLFSGWDLFHVIFWPWIVAAIISFLRHFVGFYLSIIRRRQDF